MPHVFNLEFTATLFGVHINLQAILIFILKAHSDLMPNLGVLLLP